MFILRKIVDNVESNTVIGDEYGLIRKYENPAEFLDAYFRYFQKKLVDDSHPEADNYSKSTYAFLTIGGVLYPLFKGQSNYIMTGDGQTFANVSLR